MTTQCASDEEFEKEVEEEWEDWVRPVIFISILVVAVAFFSFMYFGRTWLEGSVKVHIILDFPFLFIIST